MTNTAPSVVSSEADLLRAYQTTGGLAYDEMLDANGRVRPHWDALLAGLGGLSERERILRAARLDRRVRETGIAYDIFADPTKSSQRWQLDLVPIVFSHAEWRWLEAALVQRARLFDAILTDLYGEQQLMREGLVPAELVYSDGAYLRPCQGIVPNAGGLHFYAADLARDSSGQWRVIDSHTETLAGVGFALANRVVHTHVAGDLFKLCNSVRMAAYFRGVQSALTALCGRENARIALLSPGPHHEDYFSHAYLARYLGYLLVEGTDLRMKGSQVYLKTLEGLKQVDLIVRCAEGRAVDPLELDPGGFDGPAGLLRACRRSPRTVVNAAGSAVVQNRGLGPYLPRLAQHLLGEDLILPDAPRKWLGDQAAREHVLDNLDGLVIRTAQEGTGRPGQAALGHDARGLGEAERELLKREIGLYGARLVAEEKIGFSTAPVYGPAGARAEAVRRPPVRRQDRDRLRGDARRPRHDRRPGARRRAERPRRSDTRRLGDGGRRAGAAREPLAPDLGKRARRAIAARHPEPRRRRSLLARALRRAGRLDHARAAQLLAPRCRGQRPRDGPRRGAQVPRGSDLQRDEARHLRPGTLR